MINAAVVATCDDTADNQPIGVSMKA